MICDKPLPSTLAGAKKLSKAAEVSDDLFVLTHNYTGYPMIRQAREMVASGEISNNRVVQVEYPQGWLTVEQDLLQANWGTNPNQSGVGGSTEVIGTHTFNLACFIADLLVETLSADIQAFAPGRQVDETAHVMLRFTRGARGMLWPSQVAPGNENALRVRIYGDQGGLEWAQEDPNYLWYTPFAEPKRLIKRNDSGAGDVAARVSRVPQGQPEGHLEGFSNIYSKAAEATTALRDGNPVRDSVIFPTVYDSLKGVQFVSACVKSSGRDAAWVELDH